MLENRDASNTINGGVQSQVEPSREGHLAVLLDQTLPAELVELDLRGNMVFIVGGPLLLAKAS